MKESKIKPYSVLSSTIQQVQMMEIPEERKEVLKPLIAYIQEKIDTKQEVNLNFICTHNSRRSQLSQIWAQTAADYYGIPVNCYSGGVEVTSFNERAVDSIQRSGFKITVGDNSGRILVSHSIEGRPIITFSKLFDDPVNHAEQFAAVMTCSHADENCPFIPGTEKRIPVRYDDPKAFDDTPEEAARYDERSMQIASEMFHVFSTLN